MAFETSRLEASIPRETRLEVELDKLKAECDRLKAQIVARNESTEKLAKEQDELRAELASSHAEIERLQLREGHFARQLRIPDGGAFRNDWDTRLTGLIRERDELRAQVERPELTGDPDFDAML